MATKLAQKTALTKPAMRSIAPGNTFDYEDVPTGMEHADREAFMLPFLQVLQKLSPQVDKGAHEYIKGASDGDIYNSATGEVYSGQEGVLVLPVRFHHCYTLWTIREKGGGFKGEESTESDVMRGTTRDEKGRMIRPDGSTQVVDTRVHAVILLGDDGPTPALLSMTSTQIKKSRRWMTAMQQIMMEEGGRLPRPLPTLAHVWKLTTVAERNDKGNWSGWHIEHVGLNEDEIAFSAARAFAKSLEAGSVKMRTNAQPPEEQ